MTLSDREEVINIARNTDENTLGLTDVTKLNEIVDASIEEGKSSATAWATSVEWNKPEAQNHPLYHLYREIYHVYAAINLIMRFPESEKDIESLSKIIEIKGPLLKQGVKDMASLGFDSGVSKVRHTSVTASDITYPKNLGAMPYKSPAFLSGRRGRG